MRCIILRDIIVYFGIIQYEYNNAMCQHSAGIERLIEEIGYRPITIGVSPKIRRGKYEAIEKNKYVINDPKNMLERLNECISSKDIKTVLLNIGVERIKAMIMADFRFIPMKSLQEFCKKNGIHFVIDIMDRFVADKGIVTKIKKIDCDLRMKYLYPDVCRRIYICSKYNTFLGVGEHTAVIPGVTTSLMQDNLLCNQDNEERIKIVFFGRPGLKCEKERIDWIIKAIYEKNLTNRFLVMLAGFDVKEFLDSNPEISNYLHDNISFLGRITHESCIKLLQQSDFSLIIRENSTLSQYGFSTKIGEAFSCGIPVLVTNTSDNALYVKNGLSGFICNPTYLDVADMLERVASIDRIHIQDMKQYIIHNNALHYRNFVELFEKVVINE